MDARLGKILLAQLKAFQKAPDENFIVLADESDICKWTCLAFGLDDPFKGGEFIFSFKASKDFPQKAPVDLFFHTPSGVFVPGEKICISLGEFHTNDPGRTDIWRPSIGMAGFARNVVSVIITADEKTHGLGICVKPLDERRKFAQLSREFNKQKLPELYNRFEELLGEKPDWLPARKLLELRRHQENSSDTMASEAFKNVKKLTAVVPVTPIPNKIPVVQPKEPAAAAPARSPARSPAKSAAAPPPVLVQEKPSGRPDGVPKNLAVAPVAKPKPGPGVPHQRATSGSLEVKTKKDPPAATSALAAFRGAPAAPAKPEKKRVTNGVAILHQGVAQKQPAKPTAQLAADKSKTAPAKSAPKPATPSAKPGGAKPPEVKTDVLAKPAPSVKPPEVKPDMPAKPAPSVKPPEVKSDVSAKPTPSVKPPEVKSDVPAKPETKKGVVPAVSDDELQAFLDGEGWVETSGAPSGVVADEDETPDEVINQLIANGE